MQFTAGGHGYRLAGTTTCTVQGWVCGWCQSNEAGIFLYCERWGLKEKGLRRWWAVGGFSKLFRFGIWHDLVFDGFDNFNQSCCHQSTLKVFQDYLFVIFFLNYRFFLLPSSHFALQNRLCGCSVAVFDRSRTVLAIFARRASSQHARWETPSDRVQQWLQAMNVDNRWMFVRFECQVVRVPVSII